MPDPIILDRLVSEVGKQIPQCILRAFVWSKTANILRCAFINGLSRFLVIADQMVL